MNALRHRAALRPWRQWVIAGAFGIVWLAIMLAGSDLPPPRGFIGIVAVLAGLVVVMGLSIPSLWRVQGKHGRGRVLGISTGLGAGIGTTLAILFALKGSGEPSLPPLGIREYAIWIGVTTVVGAVNGTLVGIVTVLFRPRS